jgi:hypothetical protein
MLQQQVLKDTLPHMAQTPQDQLRACLFADMLTCPGQAQLVMLAKGVKR